MTLSPTKSATSCTGPKAVPGVAVLLEERDFYELTRAYLERARAQNVLHAEIFFDPQAHVSRAVPFEAVVAGITDAVEISVYQGRTGGARPDEGGEHR